MHLPVRLATFAAAAVVAVTTAGPASASAPPVDGTAVLDPPQPGTGIVTGRVNAVDPEGDPLTYTAPSATAQGTVAVAPDGTFVYTPNPGGVLADTFIVTVNGGLGGVLDVPVSVPAAAPAPEQVNVPPTGNSVTFTFDYGSGAEHWPPAARTALEAAGATVASYLVAPQPVTINVDVVGLKSPGDTNIAASFVGFTGNDSPGYFPTVVQEKIFTGKDPNGGVPDAQITYNFAEQWGVDPVAGNQYDFTTVAIHEMLHTLGFISASEGPASGDRNWTTYDSFLRAADGTPVIDEAFALKPQYAATLTGADGGLFFDGPNAVAAFGGPVPLFTPPAWASASRSISHVNALPGYLMDPFYDYGPGVRVITPVEMAMLRDLGYTVIAPFAG